LIISFHPFPDISTHPVIGILGCLLLSFMFKSPIKKKAYAPLKRSIGFHCLLFGGPSSHIFNNEDVGQGLCEPVFRTGVLLSKQNID
jgi:hypothetical protein